MRRRTHRCSRLAITGALVAAGSITGLSGSSASAAEVGPADFQISQGGDAPSSTTVAYNATDEEYLVVWEGATATLEAKIWGRRVDARTGTGIGSEFVVAEVSPGDPGTNVLDPDVVWNSVSNEFLVVYTRDDLPDAGGLLVNANEIFAQRVTSGGALNGAPVHVSDLGSDDANGSYDANAASVAYNPVQNEYLVVWHGDDDTAPLVNNDVEVFGQFLSSALAEVGTNDLRISDLGPDGDNTGLYDAREPTVAYYSGAFLVAWDGFDTPAVNEIHGQLVDAATRGESGTNFVISTDATNTEAVFPSVTADPAGTGALVVWEHTVGGNDPEIYGSFVTGSTPAANFAISANGDSTFDIDWAQASYHPVLGAYSVVWVGEYTGVTNADEYEVFHTSITSTGTTIEPVERVSTMDGLTGTSVIHPDVAAGAETTSGIVWVGDDAGNGDTEVFGQFVTPAIDLEIVSKTLTSASTVSVGDAVVFEITYRNNGTSPATDVVISDSIPSGVSITTAASTPTITELTGAPDYTWSIPNLAAGASGTITLTGTADGSASGLITNTATITGNALHADPNAANDSKSASVTVDVPPTVTSFTVASDGADTAYAKAGDTITATIVASEDITTPTVTIAGLAASVTGSGSSWTATITVGGSTPEGLAVGRITAAADLGGLPMVVPVTSSDSVTVDLTAPTPTISSAASNPTNTSPFDVTVDFGEAVNGFTGGDLVVGNGTAGTATGGTNGSYTVPITPTADGPVTVDLGAASAADLAGNDSLAASQYSVAYDGTAPTPVFTSAEPDPTNSSPFDVSIDFGETVIAFADTDIVVGNGAVTSLSDDGGGAFTAAITPAADGIVTVDVAAGVVNDSAGNGNSVATQFSIEFDGTAPSVAIDQAVGQADPTNGSSVEFTVVFSEQISGFSAGDPVVSGVTYGFVSTSTADAITYTVTVGGITSDGVVVVTIPAGAGTDASGLPNTASTSTDNQVTIDQTAPVSQIEQSAGQADPTNESSVEFTVTFDEDVVGFDETDVDLSSSTTPGALAAVVTGGPAVYTVAVSGYSGDGVVDARVSDGAAADAAGNATIAQPSADFQVTVDQTGPTVEVDQGAAQADPTNGDSVVFDVVFSEDVAGFGAADLVVSGTSGATNAGAVVSGSGSTYTVEITDVPADGDVVVVVATGAASDAAGNASAVSSSTDNTVTVDRTSPTVTIDQGVSQTDSANVSPIVFDVVFSEDVSGFDGADVALGGTAGATTAVVTPIDGATYTVEVSGMNGDGTVTAAIEVAAAADAVGNTSEPSTSTDSIVTYINGDVTPGVNDAPAVDAPATAAAELAEVTAFAGAAAVSVTDPDALDAAIVVTLASDDAETVIHVDATPGVVVVENDSDVVTLTGAQSDINEALATLSITANNVGDVTVTITADDQGNTDGAALTGSADIAITVTDTTAPTVTVPTGGVQVVTDRGRAGATVTFDVIVDDPGSESPARLIELQAAPTLDCEPASGGFFPIGDTSVTCTATDASGNATVESFVVTVTDNEDPVISGATDRTFRLPTGSSGAVVYPLPTATDNSGSATLTCTPASGSTFRVGVTTVTCAARDAAGNTATASFQMTVSTTSRVPDTGGSLALLPWAFALLAAGVVALCSVGASRRSRYVR